MKNNLPLLARCAWRRWSGILVLLVLALSVGAARSSAQPTFNFFWHDLDNGNVGYWSVQGFTLQGHGVFYQGLANNWHIVGSADLKKDGTNYLLWQDDSTGNVYYWHLDKNWNIVDQNFLLKDDPGWLIGATLDLKSDGHTTILWQNPSKGLVYYWEMNGTTIVSQGYIDPGFNVPDVWRLRAAARLDTTGNVYLIWRNINNGAVYYWILNSSLTIQHADYLVPPSQSPSLVWDIAGTMPPLKGVGVVTLIWQNHNTGDLYYWEMKGPHIAASNTYFTGIPADWHLESID
jgi:hypothetical protein